MRNSMTSRALLAATVGLAALAASEANAQSIDYGSLETLFGEPVTTSATGAPQRSTEAPADMQIISADEIRRSGEASLPGILQRAAGIDVLNFSAGQSDVNIRGYDQANSPRLLVLVNGRQVYQDHFGQTDWATIPVQLDEIRQIEIVKGPNSALFGFNAASGVINIITYNPKYDATNIVTASGGNLGQRQGGGVATFKLGSAVSVRLSAGGQAQDEWKAHGGTPAASALHNPASAKANLDLVAQLAPKTELRVEGSWSNVQQDTDSPLGYAVGKTVTTSEMATLSSDTSLGLIKAQAYQTQLSPTYEVSGGLRWNNRVTVASLQDLFKIDEANTFRIDGEYRNNTLNVAPVGGASVSYDIWSGSAMWNWAANPKLVFTAAVRVDDLMLHRSGVFASNAPNADNSLWDRSLVVPSANVTLAWRPTGLDTFRLSYARGVQAPSLIQFGGFQAAVPVAPGVTIDAIGNPALSPTIVTNYEVAYDRDLAGAKLGVRLFRQDWSEIAGGLSFATLNVPPTLTTNPATMLVDVSNSTESGVEILASGKVWGGVNWRANATFTDVKNALFAGVNATTLSVAFAQTTPKVRGNVGVDWTHGPWEADANLHVVGDYDGYSLTTGALQQVPTYASLSARVGYSFAKGFRIALSGQNLLTDRQVQTIGLQAEREVQIRLSKAW